MSENDGKSTLPYSVSLESRSMKGVKLVTVDGRVFRLPAATLPEVQDFNDEAALPQKNDGNASSEPIGSDNDNGGRAAGESGEHAENGGKQLDEIQLVELHVSRDLFGAIIGRHGSIVQTIQRDTKTTIKAINRRDIIEVRGTASAIQKAKQQIEKIVMDEPPTHFISLTLTDPELLRRVSTFHDDVLALNLPNVDKSIFNRPTTLHLTVGMLGLYRRRDTNDAVQLLQKLSPEINALVGAEAVVAHLPGLAIMEENSTAAHVMYARVEEHNNLGVLGKLAELLRGRFEEARYLKEDRFPFKYHATLINTKYRNRAGSSSSDNKRHRHKSNQHRIERIPFNAKPILDKFSDTDFGTCQINTITISRLGERNPNGDYIHEGSIKILNGTPN